MTLLLLLTPLVLPQGATEPPPRPDYKFLRWAEDWSALANGPFAQSDPLDEIKYVPISDDGDVWVSFGGHVRARVEAWDDFGFGAPAENNDVFGLGRALLHADVHFGEDVRLFVEGKTALATSRDLPGGKRPLDEDKLDLQQLFLDVAFGDVTLRPGRQELLFGKQRLVSPLPWGNSLRTWDGVSAHAKTGDWKTTAFLTQYVPVDPDRFNDRNEDEEFHGVYTTAAGLPGGLGLDIYWLYLDRDPAAFNGTAGIEKRHTVGARAFAKHGKLDWDVEAAAQRGDVGPGDVEAAMVGSQFGYSLGNPRVYVGFDYATGDDEPGGDVETFNQLYPLGHAWLGQADVIGRQNIVDVNAGVTFAPAAGWKVGFEAHAFRAENSADAIYNAGGGIVRPGGSYSSKDIGYEGDVTVVKRVSRHLVLSCGYSRFFAGDAIEESGADEDIDFGFVAAEYTF
jgi:hypothetical protein